MASSKHPPGQQRSGSKSGAGKATPSATATTKGAKKGVKKSAKKGKAGGSRTSSASGARQQEGEAHSARPLVPTGAGVTLDDVAAAAASCHACPLWQDNKGTVFGEGASHARVVLVGEQPGNDEDEAGVPFVGPAGRLLDACLLEAGLDRQQLYVTNAVKHFKHHRQKKRRIHDKPNAAEMRACKPWLEAELAHLQPEILVALGAVAAKQMLGSRFSITKERGQFFSSASSLRTMATWHPSAILRARAIDRERAHRMREELVSDLRAVRRALDELDGGQKSPSSAPRPNDGDAP